jgi:hypothetical protein
MEFKEDFLRDIQEAYEFWCSMQTQVPEGMTLKKWVTSIVQKPVYELIGAKRTKDG